MSNGSHGSHLGNSGKQFVGLFRVSAEDLGWEEREEGKRKLKGNKRP